MSICLSEDETQALRQIIATLAVIGERGFEDDENLCKITAMFWKYELLRPAQALRRVAPDRRLEEVAR